MIDANKLNAAILELEKSSAELNNISIVVENAKELVLKQVESEGRLEEIAKKVLLIAERCEENEKVMGDELKSLIMDMNSKNLRLFEGYHKEMDFNYHSLKTEMSIIVKSSEEGICERVTTETVKITEAIDKLTEQSKQETDSVLKELGEIKSYIQKNAKLNRNYFVIKFLMSIGMFATILFLLLR